MDLCQYRDIFGKAGEGVHSIRVLDVAIVDTLMTLLAAYTLGFYFKVKVWKVFLLLLIVAIILHRLFCVNTTINKLIFGVI